MATTPVYTRGVKYIKIAKTDANNNDNTIYLQNLDKVRMLFSDTPAVVSYPIVSITEYPSYYLYTINPTDITSSVDQEILNYKVSASSTTLNGSISGRFTTYDINTNILNYLTASSGYYTLHNTPNIIIQITGSATITYNGYITDPTKFILYSTANPLSPIVSSITLPPSPGTYNVTITGSFIPIENTSFYFEIDPGDYGVTSANLQFKVTQSVTPQSSNNDITVLEPFVGETFNDSDCNVLQNNIITNQVNGFYMVVDYTNGSIVAENKNAILNGTAQRAQVQPWNYTYDSHIRGRYVGKEQNAIAYNIYTSASSFITASDFGFSGSWPGDTTSPGLNGSVVIEQLDSCIYETNWGGGGYPENSNGGGFSLNNILLVGSNKDDITTIPIDNILYSDILNKNIPFETEFLIRQYNPTSNTTAQATSLYPGISLGSAVYWIPSNFNGNNNGSTSDHVGRFYYTGSGSINQPVIQLYATASNSYPVYINQSAEISGSLQTSSRLDINVAMANVSNSIASGTPWFVSLYNGSGSITASGSIPGLPPSLSGLPNIYQIGYPFEISKIELNPSFTTASIHGAWNISIKNAPSALFSGLPNPSWIGSEYTPITYGLGLLLTPGSESPNSITAYIPSPQNAWHQFSNIGTGYITTQYPTDTINQNINYITKKYGNNPNP
jgi:hypothetical protein